MKVKIKNKSYRYNTTRPRHRHGQKCSKYKSCLSMTMLICVKQQLSNIWSSVYEKIQQHWGWIEKSDAYKKVCRPLK